MEIKKIGEGGLKINCEINGEQVKLSEFENMKEFSLAQAYMVTIICSNFFELIKLYAEKEGVAIKDVFKDKEHFENSFKNYLGDFTKDLVRCAIAHSEANWALFENQKEFADAKCDA